MSLARPWNKPLHAVLEKLQILSKSPVPLVENMPDKVVSELTTDSRTLEKEGEQTFFIALPGLHAHGLNYISADTPVVAVLTPQTEDAEILNKIESLRQQGVGVIEVPNLEALLAELADWFYDSPSKQLQAIGITGTNGKTSTAFYTAQLLEAQGIQTALIGTLGLGFISDLKPSPNTTPEVVTVHRQLAHFALAGAKAVVMEVSSHAVALGRIDRVQFAVQALTQVTRDHLDFHGSEAAYRQTKKQFFEQVAASQSQVCWVVNSEDELGQSLISLAESLPNVACLSYGLNRTAMLHCKGWQFEPNGLQGSVVFKQQCVPCQVSLLGRFNAENVLCALGSVLSLDSDFQVAVSSLSNLQPVTGRMQRVKATSVEQPKNQPQVVVDYAHTPDGLRQALLAFRQHLSANNPPLTVVFGCGGERDQGKRPLMGAVAAELADCVVVTADNSRCEETAQIMADILQGIPKQTEVHVIEDRREAIVWAIQHTAKEGGVLIAGKGHETKQQFCGYSEPFSDIEVAQAALKAAIEAVMEV